MKRQVVKFAELFRVKHGYAFKGDFFDTTGDYVLLTPGNFHETGGFRDQGDKQKWYSGDVPNGFILEEGDVLIAMTEQMQGLLGSSIWITASGKFLHNQRLGKIIDVNESRLDRRYLYHLFNTEHVRNQISASASGTKVRHTAPERIGRVEVSLPPLKSQVKIADILSAYDDLIENNQRRMALLENSARQLYQEWFVRLRFPGYEHTKITDGVPSGWRIMELKAACLPISGIQTGPFGSQLHQSDYSEAGIPVVMPKDIVGSLVSTDSIARVPDEIRQRLARHILQVGDIVLARRGDIGRKAFINEREAGWLCGTGCMRIRPDPEVVVARMLYDTLGRADIMGIIVSRAQGAIMPNLNLGILSDIPLVLPPTQLQREYLEFVEAIHRQVEVLSNQNEKLRVARDLLLPRLMSGEVAV
jgi:type I restriction enzyme, S subunit